MTATATATLDGTAAASGRLSSVASGVLEFVWPMYLTLVFTLGAWVLVPTVALGWEPVTIISGSMAPAVQPGHVVVVEPYDGQDLGAGTVVTYRDADQDRLVTHRIVTVEDDGTLTTRGDANAVDDPVPLTRDRVVGVGRLVVPAAGLPALWAHEGRTDLLAVVAGLTVLATAAAAGAASEGTKAVRHRLSLRRGARGRSPLRTVGLATGAVAVVAVLGATAVSRAAFVGAETNEANTFQAGTVSPATGLAAVARCQLILLNLVPKVDLRWDAASRATGYQILRSRTDGSGFDLIHTTSDPSDTTYSDVGDLSFNTAYEYRVRVLFGSWTSTDAAVSVTTQRLLIC